uniref:Uncharacterized protein n=1 Tax=Fagus sylvatica TaxID=28930 RepID=A0A2N9G082_FAGSY
MKARKAGVAIGGWDWVVVAVAVVTVVEFEIGSIGGDEDVIVFYGVNLLRGYDLADTRKGKDGWMDGGGSVMGLGL